MADSDQLEHKYDVVIPYKVARNGSTEELRMALRSIDKNLLSVRDVYIVGDAPDWIQNVIHVQTPQGDTKRVNVGNSYRVAVAIEGLSDDFILMNDDMYIMKPTYKAPNWHGYNLRKFMEMYLSSYPRSYYTKMALRTNEYVPDELPHFELHTPKEFNKHKLADLMGPVPTRSVLLRTLYSNMYNLSDATFHEDVKIYRTQGSKDWHKQERFSEFASSDDNTYETVFHRILMEKFPEKSKYEK